MTHECVRTGRGGPCAGASALPGWIDPLSLALQIPDLPAYGGRLWKTPTLYIERLLHAVTGKTGHLHPDVLQLVCKRVEQEMALPECHAVLFRPAIKCA